MRKRPKAILRDVSGATAVEYALLSTLIAVALVLAVSNLGASVSQQFSQISAAMP